MSKIEILKLNDDGSQSVLVEGEIIESNLELKGDQKFIEFLQKGLMDKTAVPAQRIYPQDAQKFIRILKERFQNGYLAIREINEE